MAVNLPDELVKEILDPLLRINDDRFRNDSGDQSPFSNVQQSASVFLLVCKQWLRVSTPLLYNTVIIRSKAQAKALASVFKANKLLGTFVRKLRVEGGYGAFMKGIITASPNITDLFLSLSLWSNDSATGLISTIGSLDILNLLLSDREPRNTAVARKLVESIVNGIGKDWKNLDSIQFPYIDTYQAFLDERRNALIEAMHKATSLRRISASDDISHYSFPTELAQLAGIKHLEEIIFTTYPVTLPPEQPPSALQKGITANLRLESLVVLRQSPGLGHLNVVQKLELIPDFVPLQGIADADWTAIWDRICHFSLRAYTHEVKASRNVRMFEFEGFCSKLPPPLFLCKKINALALPHLYRHPVIRGSSNLTLFVNRLELQPALCRSIRSLHLLKHHSAYSALLKHHSAYPALLAKVLALSPPIRHFESNYIAWSSFTLISATLGSTLQHFQCKAEAAPSVQSPNYLWRFTSLVSLEWACDTQFRTDRGVLPPSLAQLRCLKVAAFHPSFLLVLEHADLPNLSELECTFQSVNLTATTTFLSKHGRNIVHLKLCLPPQGNGDLSIFNLCPRLRVLKISGSIPSGTMFVSSSSDNTTPLQIILPRMPLMQREVEKGYRSFFSTLDLRTLPGLHTIQVENCNWPESTTERDIAKSLWVGLSDNLLKKWNVKLTDREGRSWRPRLSMA